jgi:hypothetical protein
LRRLGIPYTPGLTDLLPDEGYDLPDAPTLLARLAEDGNRLVRAAARARLTGEEVTL